ncbi:zinc ABC transporter substrate-binding protein AztC [Stackebrandtia nassauensis]|uniref:Periplasmic solute binding protein n=1 Tax=Stackebrandtia nassauensis (strain DSM 44728 / CIP 108903 / NRRL B-16338 / NBRC 102104 / LLR-40K-21) TaxID=446470 RepID=D3Q419_STANL|nr:zinc ABC transporter substrate-binding protein AztC [Stackebrandtia nassauensis]ADD45904.1 periplasmic solute binding protein [Stackebrandtia nassauensis DSM 44728]
MRRGLTATLSLTVLACGMTGCAAFEADRSGIVVTTNILGDITREIVGDETDVTVLMKPGADPHSFGVSAKQAAALENAELIIHNGLGLEEGVARHVEAAAETGVPTYAVGEAVDPLEYGAGETAGQADPHFWTDPVRVGEAVDLIAGQVTEHVDVDTDTDTVNAQASDYGDEIAKLHSEAKTAFGRIPKRDRELVTNHHVFGYLAKRYDFEVIGAVVPSGTTLASPSSADLKDLADKVKATDVPAVFVDSSQPDRLARAMADETGIEVKVIALYSESLSSSGEEAATYVEMTRFNVEAIADGLD